MVRRIARQPDQAHGLSHASLREASKRRPITSPTALTTWSPLVLREVIQVWASARAVTVIVVTLMNLLVDFAQTGRIGPLYCGMPLSEAEALLGPGRPHPAIRMRGPDIDGYPYAWDGLELATAQRLVSEICIRLSPGSTTKWMSHRLMAEYSFPSELCGILCPFR
jgi:hypothetical protein